MPAPRRHDAGFFAIRTKDLVHVCVFRSHGCPKRIPLPRWRQTDSTRADDPDRASPQVGPKRAKLWLWSLCLVIDTKIAVLAWGRQEIYISIAMNNVMESLNRDSAA
jgi:hypothetical protein